jgi:hypothetical protein
MLVRRRFQRAKKQTMASLVIFQWWVLSKAKGQMATGASQLPDAAAELETEAPAEMEVE